MIDHQLLKIFFLTAVLCNFSSCTEFQKPFREEDKLFHAAPQGNGIGSLSFALYNDHRYQIMNSGGIGADYYSGNYVTKNDTIILENLSKESSLKSNRLLIFKYDKQDSSFWDWKYPAKKEISNWRDFKWHDSIMGEGDVYQLDENNKPLKDEYHFIIRLDSLKNFR